MSNTFPTYEQELRIKIYSIVYSFVILVAVFINGCSSEILSVSILSHLKYLNEDLSSFAGSLCFKYLGTIVGYLILLPFIHCRERTFVKDLFITLGIIGNFLACLLMNISMTNWDYLTVNFFFQGFSSALIVYHANRIFVPLLKTRSILMFQIQSLMYIFGGFVAVILAKNTITDTDYSLKQDPYFTNPTNLIDLKKVYLIIAMMNIFSFILMLLMLIFNAVRHTGDHLNNDNLIMFAIQENEKKIREGSRSPIGPSNLLSKLAKFYSLYKPSFHILGFIITYFLTYYCAEQILYRYFYIYINQLDFGFSQSDCYVVMIFFWTTIFVGRAMGLFILKKDFLRMITIVLKLILVAMAIALNFINHESLPLLLLMLVLLFLHGFCVIGLMTEVSGFSSYNFYYLVVICFIREVASLIQVYPMSMMIKNKEMHYFFIPVAVMYSVSAVVYYGFCFYAYKNKANI